MAHSAAAQTPGAQCDQQQQHAGSIQRRALPASPHSVTASGLPKPLAHGRQLAKPSAHVSGVNGSRELLEE